MRAYSKYYENKEIVEALAMHHLSINFMRRLMTSGLVIACSQ
jgi:hypothetical protein